jgi:2-hydroxycyclohexanecarboxyl-CoA dehydrogenase
VVARDLRGAVTLVTGAGSGIGAATARAFAAEGARVVAIDVDGEAAEKTARDCGGDFHAVDVTDRPAMDRLAATVGPLDVLVNNAGVGLTGRFLETPADDWDWLLGVNLQGVVNGCRSFGPAMVARGGGHVVNVSSGLGYTPRGTESAYVTSKAAVLAFSRCLRADWHEAGVGVTAVCPGVIDTPIIDHTKFLGERGRPEHVERTKKVFRRGHKPEKVAAAIVRAVQRDRSVVPVGIEAWAGWYLSKAVPTRAGDWLARKGDLP